ncbi:unnamed protein product [Ectocarpus sp. 6 AP-2014]
MSAVWLQWRASRAWYHAKLTEHVWVKGRRNSTTKRHKRFDKRATFALGKSPRLALPRTTPPDTRHDGRITGCESMKCSDAHSCWLEGQDTRLPSEAQRMYFGREEHQPRWTTNSWLV